MVTKIERKGEFILIIEESSCTRKIYEDWLALHHIVSLKFFEEFNPAIFKESNLSKSTKNIYCVEIVMTNGINKTYQIPELLYEQLKTILQTHNHGKSFF